MKSIKVEITEKDLEMLPSKLWQKIYKKMYAPIRVSSEQRQSIRKEQEEKNERIRNGLVHSEAPQNFEPYLIEEE